VCKKFQQGEYDLGPVRDEVRFERRGKGKGKQQNELFLSRIIKLCGIKEEEKKR
jgi:hypothetical protein